MSGDRKLQQALRDLVVALEATRVHWMIIGGIAVIARGVRRFTGDIDAAVRGDEIDVAPLHQHLRRWLGLSTSRRHSEVRKR